LLINEDSIVDRTQYDKGLFNKAFEGEKGRGPSLTF